MKKFLLIIFTLTSLMAVAGLGGSKLALADTKGEIQNGVCGASGQASCTPGNAGTNLEGTISTVVNILSAAAGVAAVIMIIIGGFRYVTSAGNAETAKNARNTLVYAVVGLIIVALAQLVVHFVLTQTTTGTTSQTNSPASSNSGVSQGAANSPH